MAQGHDETEEFFIPIRPNPYIVGNPVRGRAMFFGREAEFELVRKRFQDSAHGGLLVFCGERRSGKTSILFQILDRRLGPDFIPILVDMQSMAISSQIDFLAKIAEEIQRALGPTLEGVEPPDFTTGSNPAAIFQRYIAAVVRHHPNHKLILLFDEYELFEPKIESGVLVEDVLHILANLMENHSVFLIFTGSQHLEERRRDYWKILGKSIYKTISYLEREDALSLIRKPVERVVQYEPGVVESIWRLTAGQPFYTQAICQSLIDTLNELRTRTAGRDALQSVVDGLVNNPLPQMVFLWDSFDRDEKLVLALLAESLENDTAFATQRELSHTIERGRYPFELGMAPIATALEKLFKSEMLLKNDAVPPAYAFRMDLWRLWIRRMHSVWQVMREEGLSIRARRPARRALVLAVAAAGVIVVGLGAWLALGRRSAVVPHPGGPARFVTAGKAGVGTVALQVVPAVAMIRLDGRGIAIGTYTDSLPAGASYQFTLQAPGYADSAFTLAVDAGSSTSMHVALRPRYGSLYVTTEPAGAAVRVDGVARGTSPVLVAGLSATTSHVVEASLAGRNPGRTEHAVTADTTTTVALALGTGSTRLVVTSDPPGAALAVDGASHGSTPVKQMDLPLGRHAFVARLAGYVAADTTVDVQAGTGQVHVMLRPEPPGVLVVQGDHPAQIYVDGVLVRENVQNSGPQSVRPGNHQVRVVLVSGAVVEQSIAVGARERVVFDYSTQAVLRPENPGGTP
jgi:hypothetical protein